MTLPRQLLLEHPLRGDPQLSSSGSVEDLPTKTAVWRIPPLTAFLIQRYRLYQDAVCSSSVRQKKSLGKPGKRPDWRYHEFDKSSVCSIIRQ